MSQPYRDDHEALESRLTALEQELEAVRAERRLLEDAVRREAELAKEADAVRRRVSHMRARRSLPLLESLRVASPCKADWTMMVGDNTVRFCKSCEKNVYDLSGMTRDQAEAFVREREGSGACIRLHKRTDGTVLTSDCPVGASNAKKRRVGAAALGAALLGGGAALFAGSATVMGEMHVVDNDPGPTVRENDREVIEQDVIMGQMAIPEHPPKTPPDPSATPEAPKPSAPPPAPMILREPNF